MTRPSGRLVQRRKARLVRATREAARVADAHLARFLLQAAQNACRAAALDIDDTRQLALLIELARRLYNHHVAQVVPGAAAVPHPLEMVPHLRIRQALEHMERQLQPQVHKHPWAITRVNLTVSDDGEPSLTLQSRVGEAMEVLAEQAKTDPDELWLATQAHPADMLDILRQKTLS